MLPDAYAVLTALEGHTVGGPGAHGSFLHRLAASQAWDVPTAARAWTEYLRFTAIAASCPGSHAPSPAVDAVWRHHRSYAASYDGQFRDLLGRHRPDPDRYDHTLGDYHQLFGPPPTDLWPPPDAPAVRRRPAIVLVRIVTFGAAGVAALLHYDLVVPAAVAGLLTLGWSARWFRGDMSWTAADEDGD